MYGKRILITGITGFIGHHLAAFLKSRYPNCTITGIGSRISHTQQNYAYYQLNLLERATLVNTINKIKPDYIFHLAGLVFSYNWGSLYNGNVTLTTELLEAIKQAKISTRIIIAGTSAEYGVVTKENLPVTEAYFPKPQSPYGMTKLWQTQIAKYYQSLGLNIAVGRIFNVIGQGASQRLSTGDFFSQIQNIITNRLDPIIFVGNLEIKRDFLDVEDVCAGLVALASKNTIENVFNICSGVSVAFKDILSHAITASGLNNVEIIFDEKKRQNTYIEDIYGCNKKIKAETAWMPTIKLEDSVEKVLKSYSAA